MSETTGEGKSAKEEPTTDKPTTDKPTKEEPTTEKPTTEEATVEKPTTEKPTTKPATEKPTTAAQREEPTVVPGQSPQKQSEEPTVVPAQSPQQTNQEPTVDPGQSPQQNGKELTVVPGQSPQPKNEETAVAPVQSPQPKKEETAVAPGQSAQPKKEETAVASGQSAQPKKEETAVAPGQSAQPKNEETAAAPGQPTQQNGEEPAVAPRQSLKKNNEQPGAAIEFKPRKSVEQSEQQFQQRLSFASFAGNVPASKPDQGANELDALTAQLMQQQGNLCTLCLVCTVPAACCFWIPMIFFMAAANVPSDCENKDSFVVWLKVHGLVPLVLGVAVQALAVLSAMAESVQMFKLSLRIQVFVQLLGGIFTIWGWIVYGGGDEYCDTAEDVKPRTLALVWLVMGSICLPCVILGSIKKILSMGGNSEFEGLIEGDTVGCARDTE